MTSQQRIVIGHLGEIGRAIYKIFDADKGIDENEISDFPEDNDNIILHICIPYNMNFTTIVIDYIKDLKPILTIIHTTCKPGTTQMIYQSLNKKFPIVHCPINGKHPNMEPDIRKYTMFVGAIKEEHGQMACEYIEWYNINTYLCESPEITEISKIASTELLRVNIEFYQQMKKKIQQKNLNWAEFIAFMENIMDKGTVYKRVYQRAGRIDTPLSRKHCISENKKIKTKN